MKRNKEQILAHLNRLNTEINKMILEIREEPEQFGDLDNRLFWAIRGAYSHTSIYTKHNQKMIINKYGEYVCFECLDEMVRSVADEHADDL